jgi:uncharacterized protein YhfF
MKQILIILFLILVGCKKATKNKVEIETEKLSEITSKFDDGIDETVYEMWNDFIKSNPEFKNDEIPEADYFHNNEADADRLAKLTLTGKKKTSSGLYSLYEQYNADLPSVGAKQIVTNFNGEAKAIIENISVDTISFNKISKEYARMDMGTDVDPLKKWQKAHWDFFESFLKERGEKPTKEMLIVAVKFKKIWPKDKD